MNHLRIMLGSWWSGGEILMPIMLGAALILYLLIGERLWSLFGPRSRAGQRRYGELQRSMGTSQAAGGAKAGRAWFARAVAIAEESELSRGFILIRTLTAMLPLLGLLGTVTGMIDTFAFMGDNRGTTDFAHQSGAGIGLALTATQYGMALAVPAVVLEWLLRRRVEALIQRREIALGEPIADAERPLAGDGGIGSLA
jgi:biopolymer transport protein ExbB/TolQ